jgi:hypothetical protein
MAEFVFTSPGVKFRERDLTFVTRNVGVTTLGLVGETLKGPAFEPVFIQDKTQFTSRFGTQSIKRFSNGSLQYQLPYVANSYLNESSQLWVTRVLGLSGYEAGKAWAVTLSAGVDPDTIVPLAPASPITVAFTANSYLGVALNATGDTGISYTGFTKIGNIFSTYVHSFTAVTLNISGNGTVEDVITRLTGTSYTEYENMVVAVIRSRGTVRDILDSTNGAQTKFDTNTLTITGNLTNTGIGDLYGNLTLKATNTGYTPTLTVSGTTESYTVSLNPNSSSFLPNVIGVDAKDKKTKIYTQATYPDLIKKIDGDGKTAPSGLTAYGISGIMSYAYGINNALLICDEPVYTNYRTQFKTPETPWVVSQIKGNKVDKLFKFISISDGDAANQEIKISITNINPVTLEFDVVIRDFYDTDAAPTILEQFSRCSLIKGQTNYIAQRIGTSDSEYDLQSKYIMIELDSEITPDSFPAGFEGYYFNNFNTDVTGGAYNATTPKIFYKTKYDDDERPKKIYLGVSETGYDTVSTVGTGINQNFFNFNGYYDGANTDSFSKTNGYHMDINASGVTSSGFAFDAGAGTFATVEDVLDATLPYYELVTRKFTLVPAGGFDGWDIHRTSRSNGDLYRLNGLYDGVIPNGKPTNDFQAWETAINTYANPEEVTVNLFATPGIDWSNNTVLIKDTIEMLEELRTDSLYIVDAPDVTVQLTIGDGGKADIIAASDIADLLDTTDIDSSYACTYFPWIQIKDTQNNVNVYIPPTGEVVKAMAYTDNVKFPWFAPAGLNRGVTDARKSKYKMSQEARDILYKGRINPMADFADAGTAIFGQKTLQKKESALDRINVRRLLLQVKVLIANIAIRLVFEQNDQATIDQFLQKATPILDNIKRERGLYDFRIKMDDTNNTTETRDRNELYGEISLKPTRSVEYIGITFTLTPSGASFSE